MANGTEVQGLPEEAVVKPIQGLPEGAVVRPIAGEDSTTPPDSFIGRENLAKAPLDVLTGAAKGLGSTVAGVSRLINKIPGVGETLAPKTGIDALRQMTRPEGLKQDIGYFGEQAGEALIPGLGEEGVGLKAASLFPKLKAAAPLARVGYNALSMGGLNKLQGGSFGAGAAMGGVGGLIGEMGRAAAPSLAEGALGITSRYKGHGKTPGEAALNEVSGLRPGTIAENAQNKSLALTSDLENSAHASQTLASTMPAVHILRKEAAKAASQNSEHYFNQINQIYDQITKKFGSGAPIPSQLPAEDILNLKRGIGKMVGSWPIEQQQGVKGVLRQVYGALDAELDRAVPGSADLNQRISSLIPVSQRALSTEAGAGIPQRLAHRLAVHTGALAGAGMGAGLGYQRGGTSGAVMGGLTGLIAPEILASPTVQMLGARTLALPQTYQLGRGLTSQLLPRRSADENPQ